MVFILKYYLINNFIMSILKIKMNSAKLLKNTEQFFLTSRNFLSMGVTFMKDCKKINNMTQEIKRKITRQNLIDKGYELFNAYGYHAISIDNIIDGVGLTKGAFYYHFNNKHHFAEAIIEERISKEIHSNFIEPLNERGNPIFILSDLFHDKLLKDKSLNQHLGSPLANFIKDLNHEPNDYELQLRLKEIFDEWKIGLINFLYRGIEGGYLNRHIDTESVAEFIIASVEGIRSLRKVTTNEGLFYNYMQQLKNYFDTLKIPKEELQGNQYYYAS